MIALGDMGQGVRSHRTRQVFHRGGQPFSALPSEGGLCCLIQRSPIIPGAQQSSPKGFESTQRVMHSGLRFRDFGIAELLCALLCLANNPVMGLDYRVGKFRAPRA